jgi:hypothetical protein
MAYVTLGQSRDKFFWGTEMDFFCSLNVLSFNEYCPLKWHYVALKTKIPSQN